MRDTLRRLEPARGESFGAWLRRIVTGRANDGLTKTERAELADRYYATVGRTPEMSTVRRQRVSALAHKNTTDSI